MNAIMELEICVQIAVVAAGNLLRGFTKLVEWIFISAVYLTEKTKPIQAQLSVACSLPSLDLFR